jgi:hypothetical protein
MECVAPIETLSTFKKLGLDSGPSYYYGDPFRDGGRHLSSTSFKIEFIYPGPSPMGV